MLCGQVVSLLLAAAALAHPATVWTGCAHKPVVRPQTIVVACGDGNFYIDSIRWTRWGASAAVGAGAGHQNDCTPYCAAGHFHTYPIAVRLSGPVTCVSNRREFARVSWHWISRRPNHTAAADFDTLPCRFLKLKP